MQESKTQIYGSNWYSRDSPKHPIIIELGFNFYLIEPSIRRRVLFSLYTNRKIVCRGCGEIGRRTAFRWQRLWCEGSNPFIRTKKPLSIYWRLFSWFVFLVCISFITGFFRDFLDQNLPVIIFCFPDRYIVTKQITKGATFRNSLQCNLQNTNQWDE